MWDEVAIQSAVKEDRNNGRMQDHKLHRALVFVPAPPYQLG